jgi:CRP/FNR family transcriptional regulator
MLTTHQARRKDCQNSALSQGVIYVSLNQWVDSISHRVYPAKQALYFAGDRFNGLYQLRSGSAKSAISSYSGMELVTQFFLPGDLIGVDGFYQNSHTQNVQFLEKSSVGYLSAKKVNALLANSEQFRHQLLSILSSRLTYEQHMQLNHSYCTGEQRVAQFLIRLSDRFEAQGLLGNEFRLPMTRTDMASYLGMAIETLCRVLAHLQHDGIIDVRNRVVEILNRNDLQYKGGLQSAALI